MAITTVPLISDLVANQNFVEVRHQFERGIQLILFIMFPGGLGMMVVAKPLYTFFFGAFDMGTTVTQIYAIVSVFMALYLLLGNILQSVNQRRRGIYALLLGFLVKLITQPIAIFLTEAYGILWSTILGLAVTIALMFKIMYDTVPFSKKLLGRRSLLLFILSMIMFVVAYATQYALGFVINFDSRSQSLIAIFIVAIIGGATYLYLVLKTRIADRLIGERAANLRNKLRIK